MIYHDATTVGRWDGRLYQLDDLAQTVTRTTEVLRAVRGEFDAIVVTGMSGTLVGSPVALRLRKPLVVIRKDNDDSHHGKGRIINRDKLHNRKRALFLDDFVSNGDTKKKVVEKVAAEDGVLVGTYLYRDDELELSS